VDALRGWRGEGWGVSVPGIATFEGGDVATVPSPPGGKISLAERSVVWKSVRHPDDFRGATGRTAGTARWPSQNGRPACVYGPNATTAGTGRFASGVNKPGAGRTYHLNRCRRLINGRLFMKRLQPGGARLQGWTFPLKAGHTPAGRRFAKRLFDPASPGRLAPRDHHGQEKEVGPVYSGPSEPRPLGRRKEGKGGRGMVSSPDFFHAANPGAAVIQRKGGRGQSADDKRAGPRRQQRRRQGSLT